MSYILNYISSNDPLDINKPSIEVKDGLSNNSTSLTFVGQGFPDYGKIIWQNFLYLLENFASVSPPDISKATIGQLWYNSNEGKLTVFDGNSFTYISGDDLDKLNKENLLALLNFEMDPNAIKLFDGKYIKTTGVSAVNDADITFTTSNLLYIKDIKEEDHLYTIVNKKYIADVISGDIAISGLLYLQLTGGNMKPHANITLSGLGKVQQEAEPELDVDLITLKHLKDNYLSFKGEKRNVTDIHMVGQIYLASTNCTPDEDSLALVCAKWVMDKIRQNSGTGTSGKYVDLENPTGQTVKNTLTFPSNNYVYINSVDEQNDITAVNLKYIKAKFIRRDGGTNIGKLVLKPNILADDLDDDTLVTAKWVNKKLNPTSTDGTSNTIDKDLNGNGWVEFPNGMVMITGKFNAYKTISPMPNTPSVSTLEYEGVIQLPNNYKLKLPYTINANSTGPIILTAALNNTSTPTAVSYHGSFYVKNMTQNKVELKTQGAGISTSNGGNNGPASVECSYTITGFKA